MIEIILGLALFAVVFVIVSALCNIFLFTVVAKQINKYFK